MANRVFDLQTFTIDCLVDRKGQESNLSSLVIVANQRKHYTISLSFVLIESKIVVIELGTI